MAENPSDLVGKEFIFEYGVDRIFPPSEETGGLFTIKQRAFRRERVVRCRDCSMYDAEDVMCLRDPEHTGRGWHADPDGFCAWGNPMEG